MGFVAPVDRASCRARYPLSWHFCQLSISLASIQPIGSQPGIGFVLREYALERVYSPHDTQVSGGTHSWRSWGSSADHPDLVSQPGKTAFEALARSEGSALAGWLMGRRASGFQLSRFFWYCERRLWGQRHALGAWWLYGSVAPLAAVPGGRRGPGGFPRTGLSNLRHCERACSRQVSDNGPASRACGAIDDPGMIERRARPNEVAHEPDARQRLGQSSTDLR